MVGGVATVPAMMFAGWMQCPPGTPRGGRPVRAQNVGFIPQFRETPQEDHRRCSAPEVPESVRRPVVGHRFPTGERVMNRRGPMMSQ